MLYLIGLGLHEKDLTLRGLDAAKDCDKLYVELYTSPWKGLNKIKKILGKEIKELKRNDLEENKNKILREAKNKKIGILVPGDPLVATTHIDLFLEAKKDDIKCVIVHAPSIYSSITETGLFIYKFGKTTTIPFSQEGYEPKSPYETIEQNKSLGLHTLCLLDIKERPMTPKEAIEYLLEGDAIKEEEKILLFSLQEKTFITWDKAKNIMERDSPTPAVLIIPGKLHFKEKEALELWD